MNINVKQKNPTLKNAVAFGPYQYGSIWALKCVDSIFFSNNHIFMKFKQQRSLFF